jgi:hypothetical protein
MFHGLLFLDAVILSSSLPYFFYLFHASIGCLLFLSLHISGCASYWLGMLYNLWSVFDRLQGRLLGFRSRFLLLLGLNYFHSVDFKDKLNSGHITLA